MSIPADHIPGWQLRSTRLWHAASILLDRLHDDFFTQWDRGVRGFKLDDVHDLRVASRRLREGLALFSPVLPPKKAARLSRRVKRVTDVLGELRNIDEAAVFFSAVAAEEGGPARAEAERLARMLSERREVARKELKKGLTSLDAGRLKRELAALHDPAAPFRLRAADPFTRIGAFAESALAERERLVEELLPAALQEADSVAQHKLRIAFKKLRYRLEILAPLLDDGAAELRQLLKRHQDILGKLHDLDVFAGMVTESLPEGSPREELFAVLAKERAALFSSFETTHREQPLGEPVKRVRDELRPRLPEVPAKTRPRPRRPGKRRGD